MIAKCFLPVILFLFTTNSLLVNGAEWNGDLDNYFCNRWSPLLEHYVSRTDPPVAITHIFCGHIKFSRMRDGRIKVSSEGFHARPGNKNPRSAQVKFPIKYLGYGVNRSYCPYKAKVENVMVLDARQWKLVPREHNSNKYFMFFPSSWGKEYLVNRITEVFQTCKNGGRDSTNCVTNGNMICKRNYNYEKCPHDSLAFKLFLSGQEDHRLVVSAFPDASCR